MNFYDSPFVSKYFLEEDGILYVDVIEINDVQIDKRQYSNIFSE